MASTFLDAVKKRRTHYALSKDLSVSLDQVKQIVTDAVAHVPAAFNSQSSRVAVLAGKHHDELWDEVLRILQGIVTDPEAWKGTAQRIAGFKAAAGTVLFFEDQDVVAGLQKAAPLYADNFPLWSLQSTGMLQFAVWTALHDAGLGASLQHYNPLIDSWVAQKIGAPASWKLWAQMPFGKAVAGPKDKETAPVESRVKFFG